YYNTHPYCSSKKPMQTKLQNLIGLGTLVIFLELAATPVLAALNAWDGSTSGNWGTSANWVENDVPSNGDDLVFPSTAMSFTITNGLSNRRYNKITFTGNTYSLRGFPITLTNGIFHESSGANVIELTVTNGTSQTYSCNN